MIKINQPANIKQLNRIKDYFNSISSILLANLEIQLLMVLKKLTVMISKTKII